MGPRFRGDDSISHLRNLEHRRMEQLLDGDLALDQTLLVQILGQRGDLAYVLGDAIGPEIFSHERHGLLRFGDQPRQRHHQRVDIEEVGHGQRLGLAERFVDARRQPWIFLHELLADADEVHEREHAGLFVVGLLGFARVGEQPFDVRFAAQERRGRPRREQRVQLAIPQHTDERLLFADGFEVEARNRLERGALVASRFFLTAAAPMDLLRQHAVFVLQHAAHPDHGGDLIFRPANPLALEIGPGADAGIAAHIDAGMPEQPRDKGWDADIGRIARGHGADIAREREFRDVELLIAEGAEEYLLGIERQVSGRAAFHLYPAIPDGARAVVIAARNGYRHLDPWASFSRRDGMEARAEIRVFGKAYLFLFWL